LPTGAHREGPPTAPYAGSRSPARPGNGTICRRICAGRSRRIAKSSSGWRISVARVCEVEIDRIPTCRNRTLHRQRRRRPRRQSDYPAWADPGGSPRALARREWSIPHYDPQSGRSGRLDDGNACRAQLIRSFTTEMSETMEDGQSESACAAAAKAAPPLRSEWCKCVVDALSGLGVTHIERTGTAERVWRAIRQGKAQAA